MQHNPLFRFALLTVTVTAIVCAIVYVGALLSDRVPLAASGPLLFALILAIAWHETRA